MTIVDTGKELKRSTNSSRAGNQEVEFSLMAPHAKKVSVAGQFNNWDPQALPMKKGKDGAWKVKVKLPRGTCEYKYFVDGSWFNDAAGQDSVPNPYGTTNCVITVH